MEITATLMPTMTARGRVWDVSRGLIVRARVAFAEVRMRRRERCIEEIILRSVSYGPGQLGMIWRETTAEIACSL